MIQSLFRYLKGYVKIRITGYSPERFLNMCCFHGIRIWELKSVGNAYEMYISLAGFRKLRPFARKTHMRISVLCPELPPQRCIICWHSAEYPVDLGIFTFYLGYSF